MAERPEDLNLPNAVITRIIKEAVSFDDYVFPSHHWIIVDNLAVFVIRMLNGIG